MKKVLKKVSQVLQVVLLAPIKLPVKVLQILKYVALGLGVVETVLDKGQETDKDRPPLDEKKEGSDEME